MLTVWVHHHHHHLSLIKQINKTQPYNRAKLVNVFKEHSVDIVSVISLDS